MSLRAVDILLVEDNPDDIDLTLHTFRRNHLANTIHVVRNGEEALDFLFCRGAYASREFEEPPKIVFLDLNLPKVNGLAVLRSLKDDKRTQSLPVVVMISSPDQRAIVEEVQPGCNLFVEKPVAFEDFRAVMRDLGFSWLVVAQPTTLAKPCDK